MGRHLFFSYSLPRFHGSQIYAVCVHYGALLEFYVSVLKDNKPLQESEISLNLSTLMQVIEKYLNCLQRNFDCLKPSLARCRPKYWFSKCKQKYQRTECDLRTRTRGKCLTNQSQETSAALEPASCALEFRGHCLLINCLKDWFMIHILLPNNFVSSIWCHRLHFLLYLS